MKTLKNNLKFNLKKAIKKREKTPKLITKTNKHKTMIYSKDIKELINKNPGLFKEIKLFLKGKYFQNPYKIKFKNNTQLTIEKIKRPSKNGILTTSYYVVEIKTNNRNYKYFIKYKKDPLNVYNCIGTREIKALEIIKLAGFNVIPAHFAWKQKNKGSYIFYSHQSKMIDVEKAYNQKLINDKDVKNLSITLKKVERKVNSYIKEKYPNKKIKITDIAPNKEKENHALPLFIDFENKKLFLFDPMLEKVS